MKFIVSIFLQIEKFDFKNYFKRKMNTDDSQSSNLLNSSLYDFKFAKVSLEIFASREIDPKKFAVYGQCVCIKNFLQKINISKVK